MNRWLHQALPLLILIALAGLTIWLERTTSIEDKPSSGKLRHDPDVIIDNFTLHRFDLTGLEQHTLTASQARHFPDNDSTEMDAPKLLYTGKLSPTHITADHATVTKDSKQVILRDNVHVLREATHEKAEMTLSTASLTVYPDDELAVTDQPVRLTQGASVATGVGLVADRSKELYVLESRVKATIERNSRP